MEMAENVRYGGNPDHKRDPSDFNLSPASSPRPGATLCDELGAVTKAGALATLKEGFRRGMTSAKASSKWPKHIWSMYEGRFPVEATIENPENGTYHGYPLQANDPFSEVVKKRWRANE